MCYLHGKNSITVLFKELPLVWFTCRITFPLSRLCSHTGYSKLGHVNHVIVLVVSDKMDSSIGTSLIIRLVIIILFEYRVEGMP